MAHVLPTNQTADAAVSLNRLDTVQRVSRILLRRRMFVIALNVLTVGALAGVMIYALGYGGWTVPRVGMALAFAVTLPWLSIGFWNALIGVILNARGPSPNDPLAIPHNAEAPITTRTAIVMAVRNEDAERTFLRLKGMFDDLEANGVADHFDVHVLSDTNDPAIAAREEAAVQEWRSRSSRPDQIFYRRRSDNQGYKAGNLQEFCRRCVQDYQFFLPLDADSFLSAQTILQLVRKMEQNPRLGILQTLVVGTPSTAFFTRVFQFGMRHGMRAYTAGSAWWTGDCGPYWGHNALIRMRPFAQSCELPVLPGGGPLGGHVMSHDQMEAVMMRRAGYHVRVIAEEGESWEENPPSLPDFIRRELRWCQGNMQYFRLLGTPGLKAMSRVQLALVIMMYLGPPAWMAFIALGAATLFDGVTVGVSPVVGFSMFAAIIFMSLAPKIMGVVGILLSNRESARYGGRLRVFAGAILETVVSMLMAPVVAFAIAIFVVGLIFGKTIDWRAQPRGDRTVGWGEAARSFWPQTLGGVGLFALLAFTAPAILPWASPVIAGLALSIPFAVVTTSPALGRLSVRTRLCDIPEDPARPPALRRLDPLAFAPA
ncbi:MAG: glucans biosynthesis glucosyltransferase MdoH [Pseudomonadota bacterium]